MAWLIENNESRDWAVREPAEKFVEGKSDGYMIGERIRGASDLPQKIIAVVSGNSNRQFAYYKRDWVLLALDIQVWQESSHEKTHFAQRIVNTFIDPSPLNLRRQLSCLASKGLDFFCEYAVAANAFKPRNGFTELSDKSPGLTRLELLLFDLLRLALNCAAANADRSQAPGDFRHFVTHTLEFSVEGRRDKVALARLNLRSL